MSGRNLARARLLVGGPLVVSGLLVSGCMSSPTYGTGKSANAQLDVRRERHVLVQAEAKPPIEYTPRPELVKPAKATTELPPPQESIATAANPNGPNRRSSGARACAPTPTPMWTIRATTRRSSDVAVSSTEDRSFKKTGEAWRVPSRAGNASLADEKAQSEEFKKLAPGNKQGSPTMRKFLSEPPLEYRQACRRPPRPANSARTSTRRSAG